MVRFTKQFDPAVPVVLSPNDCVGHRCDEHEDVPPVNSHGPHGSECALCVAQTLVDAYEAAFEKKIFWPIITSARDRLNLLSPGTGDKFVEEARATLNTASIDDITDDEEGTDTDG